MTRGRGCIHIFLPQIWWMNVKTVLKNRVEQVLQHHACSQISHVLWHCSEKAVCEETVVSLLSLRLLFFFIFWFIILTHLHGFWLYTYSTFYGSLVPTKFVCRFHHAEERATSDIKFTRFCLRSQSNAIGSRVCVVKLRSAMAYIHYGAFLVIDTHKHTITGAIVPLSEFCRLHSQRLAALCELSYHMCYGLLHSVRWIRAFTVVCNCALFVLFIIIFSLSAFYAK